LAPQSIYLSAIGMDVIEETTTGDAIRLQTEKMKTHLRACDIIGMRGKAAVLSFAVDGVHPHEWAHCSNQQGKRCANGQPLAARPV